ncbi:MAG: helix-turn-helix domain-containing protein [Pseudohongiellaceae bacterium]
MAEEKLQCSVSIASTFFGEPWSMLILREFMIFGGTRRFEQLYSALGVSRNVLTKRLRRLIELDLIKKSPISENSRRMEYKLRRKGWELLPVMLALHQWSERWIEEQHKSHVDYLDIYEGKPLAKISVRSASGKILGPPDIRVVSKTPAAKNYFEEYQTRNNKKD